MPNPQLSILVVDDAKFSSAMIGRTLSQAGYQDVRFASSAEQALQQIEERPTGVLLADWLMPDIDGLELTARVRQLDEMSDHYTYIMLLTGKEGDNALGEAFDHGVDDFISKTQLSEQLVPRIYAGDRLCNTLHRLLQENRLLTQSIACLEQRNLVDPLTGLGNLRYLRQKLADSLRQIDSRGGALCYVLIGLPKLLELRTRHGDAFHQELLSGIARRLQLLVRPLDVLVRLDDQHFALIALLSELNECRANSFTRLAKGFSQQPFKTREGLVELNAVISLVGLDAEALPQTPEDLMTQAAQHLPQAHAGGRIAVQRLTAR
ncbi:response regulator [Serpens gallinarum]|jgi:diguanylate cyclase (GGDEF)-like protein|uniref:Response regulator n=1 Tax=Serpens gallinarum TaxID=2763075 RepID=A0ABR8TK57_9PSED|nr:response regulator [Serpens gallinarum]MBD7976142.1 response regulator [Serpens gallinarum]